MEDIEKFESRNEKSAVTVVPQSGISLVEMAMQKNYDPEFISKMMDLQERNEAKVAKQAYVTAMAEFKFNLPTVFKDKKNKQYDSMYASESALFNTINPELSKHGLSASFSFPDTEGSILKVTCIITHKGGHSESITLPGPIDISGSKNPLQQVKSTVTYLKKATFEAITGIASSDPISDDDGNSSGLTKTINDKQVSTIMDLINAKEADETKFCEYMKVEKVEDILSGDFNKAIIALNKKKKPTRQPGDE